MEQIGIVLWNGVGYSMNRSKDEMHVQVDCTADGKDTCSNHGVGGYPTLKAFKRGEKTFDYEGPRDAGKLEIVCRLFFVHLAFLLNIVCMPVTVLVVLLKGHFACKSPEQPIFVQ